MMKLLRRFTVLVLVAALMMAPITAAAVEKTSYDVTDASIAGDFLLARPMGLLATVIGSVLFVSSLPFAALGKNIPQVANLLVVEPAKFTFSRPLGQF